MAIIKQPVVEVKMCYDPQLINGIIEKIDKDPEIAPKGLAQIDFYHNLASVLRFNGELMDVTVDRDVHVPDDDPRLKNVGVPQKEVKVWDRDTDSELEVNPDPADIVSDIAPDTAQREAAEEPNLFDGA